MKQHNLEILSFSEKGIRARNEDRVYYKKIKPDTFLFLIADGMGGYENGEAAAIIAIDIISRKITENIGVKSNNVLIDLSFAEANFEINQYYTEAGTTICGMLIEGINAHVFWAGDVKIFLKNGINMFSNQEHTLLNLFKDSNTFVKDEEISRFKNTVTKALGGKANNYLPEHVHIELSDNFKGIICSDGVHQFFTNQEIFDILNNKNSIEAFNELKDRASTFSKDNFSAILFY